jgi:tetratricopeptide (TPR) repeat protein
MGGGRSSTSVAFLAAMFCVAGLCLVACGKSAAQYIERGNQLYAAGQYGDAVLNYRNAIKKSPDSGEAYYRLGLALLKQDLVGEAYQAFSHAVPLSPKNMRAKAEFGALSLAIYSRDPKHPAALYNQGKSMADALLGPGGNRVEGLRLKSALDVIDNQPSKAVEALREAAGIAPNNQEVAGGLAEALLRDKQPDEAEKVARQAVEHHPHYDPPNEVLFAIAVSQQNWEKAEADLKSWGANNPKESAPILRLAAFYYARKQPDDGEKALNSLLERRDQFPQADLLVGDFHALVHNPQKALEDYQRGEARDASRRQTYQQRSAITLATLGRREEALKTADAILAKDPKNEFARMLKVQLLEQAGGKQNLTAAAALAGDLSREAPANVRIQLLAGQAFMTEGDADQALQHFQRAAQADRTPTSQLAMARVELLRRNYAAVLDHANAALAISQNSRDARLLHVIGLTGTHSYAAAKTEAEQLARDTKDAPQVEMQLGVIALGQGRYSEAEDLFRRLYKDRSGDLQPLAGLVNTLEAEHMPDRALALMQEETQRSPGSRGKEALLVTTAEAAGKGDVALAELQKMAAQNPTSPDVQIRIGILQQRKGNRPEALQAFERVRQLAPERKGIDALIANLQEQEGKKMEAIANYRKALAKSPDDPTVLNNLAFLLADTGGDSKEALQLASTALRKAPDVPQLRDTLAWIHIKARNTSEALPILQALINKYPDNNTFRYHYAVALMQSGDRAAARAQAQTALSQKPSTELDGELRSLLAQAR